MNKTNERSISFDILRILSAFSVVVLHVSSMYLTKYGVSTTDFKTANFINSVSRFGVPVFVMISGAIFLSESKQITTEKLWKHNILRLFILYVIWSFAYYVFQSLYLWKFDFWRHGLVRTITGCVYASNHFWFIFMIIGLYALVPILRTWLHHSTEKELKYFIRLFVVFQILRTTLEITLDKSLTSTISELVEITELTGYLGYFILGYYLTHYKISNKWKILLYALVPVGIAANYFISNAQSIRYGYYSPGIYDSFGLFTFLHVTALFVFVIDVAVKVSTSGFFARLLKNLSLDTLGIYMMHIALLTFLTEEQFIWGQISTLPGIILLSILCFLACGCVAAILRRIPYIGRYLS